LVYKNKIIQDNNNDNSLKNIPQGHFPAAGVLRCGVIFRQEKSFSAGEIYPEY
jgi:hypothetical protein